MERFQDPERLAALFARCRIPERLPWTAAYPWTLQYYEKGEYLCRLREPMESLYLLLEGGIQTSLTNAAGRTRPGDRVRPLFAQSGGKEAGEQGHQHHANDGDTRARHELLHSL